MKTLTQSTERVKWVQSEHMGDESLFVRFMRSFHGPTDEQNEIRMRNLTSLCHSNTGVDNGKRVVGLVGNNMNEKLRLRFQLALVSEPLETNLVQGLQYRNRVTSREYFVTSTK